MLMDGIILLSAFTAKAQEMSVRQFFEAPTDLTANTPGTMVKDQNGEVCALIKVETTLDGFSWDVGSLGVMDTKRVGGEIWVYVPFGVRKITISHPQLGVIRDYHFPSPLEKARTYILKLNATLGTRTYDSSKKQKMILQVYPIDAKVEINGVYISLDKNGMFEQELSFGIHDITVSSPKYHTIHRAVSINDPYKAQIICIRLKQAFGWLKINGDGDETLSIDGKPTPFTSRKDIELISGHYQIHLEKPYYKPYDKSIEIQDSTRFEITPSFVPNFRELEFKVYGNAQIWIDDVNKGVGSWKGKLEYGTHTIRCELEGYRTTTLTQVVDVHTIGPIVLESPSPIYGSLIVSSTPDNADVFIDGKFVGNTPGAHQVIIGDHTVSIRKPGYNAEDRTILIKENESSRIEVKLDNIIPITINPTPKNASIFIDGQKQNSNSTKVIAGKHVIKLTAMRYYDFEKKININEPYKTYNFKMKRRYYYPSAFYVGVQATSALKDVCIGGYIGGYIKNFNIEATVLYGVMSSETIYWNSVLTDSKPEKYTYKPLIVGGRFGYGFILGSRTRLTPQIGVNYIRLTGRQIHYLDLLGTQDHNSSLGFNPVNCEAVSIVANLKTTIAIASCLELNLSPGYDFAVYKSDIYSVIYKTSPQIKSWVNGFRINFGFGLFF